MTFTGAEAPEKLNDIRLILDQTDLLLSNFRVTALAPLRQAIQTLLENRTALEVGVFGRYKAGKSSLINFLAGREVLPVGVLPVTSVITKLSHGYRELVRVDFFQGGSTAVPLTEIGSYVSETENPGNWKQVCQVMVELPELVPYHDLEFIDTPGLGSVHGHNTKVSLDWLPHAGVALVAISVDQPFSEDDAAFIARLRDFTPHIVIILSKGDRVNELELAEVSEFTRREIQNRFGTEFPVFPISSRISNTWSGRNKAELWRRALDENLLKPLAARSGEENTRLLRHKVGTLLAALKSFLEVALLAAASSEEERAGIRDYILGEHNRLSFLEEELDLRIRRAKSRIYARFEDILLLEQKDLERRLAARLRDRIREWKMNLWRLTRTYEKWLSQVLAEELSAISIFRHQDFLAPLREAEKATDLILEHFRDRLALRMEERLGIKIPRLAFATRVKEPTHPDIACGRVFDSHLDSLWFFVPMALFRPLVVRHLFKELAWESGKNLSRLAAQWSEKVNQAIDQVEEMARRYVRDQIATVENILNQTPDRTVEIRRALAEVAGLTRAAGHS